MAKIKRKRGEEAYDVRLGFVASSDDEDEDAEVRGALFLFVFCIWRLRWYVNGFCALYMLERATLIKVKKGVFKLG